jgi:hypothetical protein
MNVEPTTKDMAKLWTHCMNFIEKQSIGAPETIHQCDWVIENAYEFIEGVCNIVGYVDEEEE